MAISKKTSNNNSLSLLKTSQAVVHISHGITLRQYKYWILLLHFYRETYKQSLHSEHDGAIQIPISKISEYMGYEPVKAELRGDFEVLRKEPIVINILSKDGHKAQRGMGFISEWEVSSKTVYVRLPTFLEDVMKGLDDAKAIFHLMHWEIFSSFNGKYEAIIYKLCKDYVGVQRTPYMSISDFRQYIGLQETEYLQFAELNRWTISKPISVINGSELSDITVTAEFDRKGRKVEGVYFKVVPKQHAMSVGALTDLSDMPHPAFSEARITIPVSEQYVYLESLSPELIQATIERANNFADEKLAKNEPVNLGAIYKSAFANKWGVQYLEQKALLAKNAQEKKKRTVAAKQKAPSLIEHAQDKSSESKLRSIWNELPDDIKAEYLKRALNNVPRGAKSLETKNATLANAMERPLLRIEIEKLLVPDSMPS
ncbi:replication initiator protein [Fluviicoccus keumensis]|uniref:Replication initiator protein n=1 Tax=Fluviicoccus keumensis TaxID=1435465 RepID=A0A4Q7YH65_9GAMM|nr:replication initiation protein [Fluviicoccus keumensis]RZU36747.1 replication initiator protein [Fluviicoccus keumensis]